MGGDSADSGLARDMSIHHAQAVEMSFIVRSRSSAADVGTLSYDIITPWQTSAGCYSTPCAGGTSRSVPARRRWRGWGTRDTPGTLNGVTVH
ncbi:DUF305 domain-containing protein [Streptomyces sp. NPDC059656]|uniref:DUF305 domain-containing protein n=1 Tax=Streptomyces sp. NPDC059656 TaxID=3346898 RepID=UPI003686252A